MCSAFKRIFKTNSLQCLLFWLCQVVENRPNCLTHFSEINLISCVLQGKSEPAAQTPAATAPADQQPESAVTSSLLELTSDFVDVGEELAGSATALKEPESAETAPPTTTPSNTPEPSNQKSEIAAAAEAASPEAQQGRLLIQTRF